MINFFQKKKKKKKKKNKKKNKKKKKKKKKKTKQNNSLTVSLEHASLHETNRGGYTFECNCMLL